MTTATATAAPSVPAVRRRHRLRFLDDPRITRQLVVGVLMLTAVVVFAVVGPLVVNEKMANVGATVPRLPPDLKHFLGTDTQGRDLWTVMALGTGNTLKIGLIAGVVGVTVGLVLALIAGFAGGLPDSLIRIVTDSLLTVPAVAILVIIASNVEQMTIEIMALTVAALAWMFPCRTIRSQVLSIRERSYVEVARANGVGSFGLIFKEIMPNLMPFVMASFVGAFAGAMLAAIGLEALGLGAIQTQTLGVTIYWSQQYTAVLRGFWWWWGPPIVMIAFIFLALFITSAGMDRFANPRLRRD